MAREAGADMIVMIGRRIGTDAAKARSRLENDIRSAYAEDALCRLKVLTGLGIAAVQRSVRGRQIAVPTTLSAGEFSAIAGVTDERSRVKEPLRHPRIIPRAVVLDPGLITGPHSGMACSCSTGIRAVDHSSRGHLFGRGASLCRCERCGGFPAGRAVWRG